MNIKAASEPFQEKPPQKTSSTRSQTGLSRESEGLHGLSPSVQTPSLRQGRVSKENSTGYFLNDPCSFADEPTKSARFTEVEHELGFWNAARLYWPAVCWSFFINLATVLKGVDGNVVGSLVGLEPFKETFGYNYGGENLIAANWLGAFNYANSVGAIFGALLAGHAYDTFGPKKVIAVCSTLSIGVIFVQFFADTPAQLFVGELINGIIIAFYPICASAFIGEVCPLPLRGFAASLTNLAFAVGQFVAAGILKGTNNFDSELAYKIPLATQWGLPAIMLAFIFFCPDPPYWLCRKGRYEMAARSLQRLAVSDVDVSFKLAHVKETLRLEESYKGSKPNIVDCFRGANFRRLVICVMAYDMQAFTGNNLFISYAVYFFELAGLSNSNAFSLNLGLTALGFTGTILSWPLMSHVGRRTAYIGGCAGLMVFLFLIGAVDLAPRTSSAPTWAQCAFMLCCNFTYDITLGPFCYVLLSEVSSSHLRGLTIALATVTSHIWSIVFSVSIPYAVQADEANWGGKVGFLYSGLAFLCVLYCFFFLPETQNRTFEELDVMFERRVPSRQFAGYVVDAPAEARIQLHDFTA